MQPMGIITNNNSHLMGYLMGEHSMLLKQLGSVNVEKKCLCFSPEPVLSVT